MDFQDRNRLKSFLLPVFITLLFGVIFTLPEEAAGQHELNRISAVERSDGKGFVVRYHQTAPADSFKIFRPSKQLIQMVLYSQDMDTANFSVPDRSDIFKEINVFDIPSGFAFDFHIQDDVYVETAAYPDQNRRDLLLSLTHSNPDTDNFMNQLGDLDPINWALYQVTYQEAELSNQQTENPPENSGNGKTLDVVVLDAGHGGRDPGSIGYGGIREKDIALAITLKVGEYIKENIPDLKVVYTREDDTFVGLAERGEIANRANGDLFVSIHANSFSQSRVHGAEIYFLGMARSESALNVIKRENSVIQFEDTNQAIITDEDMLIYELANAANMRTSETLAAIIESQFRERAARSSRGVKQGPFQVLYEASMPSVLVELGFITNPDESRYLRTEYGQSILASAIYRSIRDFKVEYDRTHNRQNAAR